MAIFDENYLLESKAAKRLYTEVKDLPILDAHNHGDIAEIVENTGWSDIWEVQGETDHYVWEMMRKRGIPEERITGDAPNKTKWLELARIMPELIGNPVYEWVHLDLRRRFGIEEAISSETGEQIWKETSAQLKDDAMRPQELLAEMGVEIMCTTDDPVTSLPYHERAKTELTNTRVLPTWRPDKSMKIESDQWKDVLNDLSESTGQDVSTLSGLLDALETTHKYFEQVGCVASDHGVEQPHAYYVSKDRAASIHEKAYAGNELTQEEINDYHAYLLVQFGRMNAESDWVTQLHIGAVRDYRDTLWELIGPDSGGDLSTQNIEFVKNLKYFLNEFDEQMEIVLYCVDPTHLPTLATLARAFPNVSLGMAWWWNDSPIGMERHLEYVGSVDILRNHAGMVTDSRKLLSFGSRTEMFRRTLCNVVGSFVERGQAPESAAVDLVKALSYDRPKELFFK
ncbi:MAG: glucuronate isomerase [Candidatus Marinimicrobia bacterium]|nr:glucuronate isomerase [Candidatus Neomarinimicrobiota bacterium]MCF7827388.1 glucuronate isomerase [Candidatus Neomarinimicrobiota bacterium]MCF7881379.1 glucuronate isomerase [Candidatus Neomarinimicrobiota bacterium]